MLPIPTHLFSHWSIPLRQFYISNKLCQKSNTISHSFYNMRNFEPRNLDQDQKLLGNARTGTDPYIDQFRIRSILITQLDPVYERNSRQNCSYTA
jgi:hypothetical protein